MRAMILLVLLSGCATVGRVLHPQDGPGIYVTDQQASLWGCRGEYVRLAAKDYASKLPKDHVYTPQVGWDVCELLARVGPPREHESQQSVYGRSASLWYGAPLDPHLVRIVQDGSRWKVEYVSW